MPKAVPASSLQQKVVFVVDDEHVIANTLAVILKNSGFAAHGFFSGQEAVDASYSLQPDLLLTDVIMPGMTGIEAAIIIGTRHPKCKILLFSGQAITMDLVILARSQGHDFEILAKPVHPVDLLEKIRSLP